MFRSRPLGASEHFFKKDVNGLEMCQYNVCQSWMSASVNVCVCVIIHARILLHCVCTMCASVSSCQITHVVQPKSSSYSSSKLPKFCKSVKKQTRDKDEEWGRRIRRGRGAAGCSRRSYGEGMHKVFDRFSKLKKLFCDRRQKVLAA